MPIWIFTTFFLMLPRGYSQGDQFGAPEEDMIGNTHLDLGVTVVPLVAQHCEKGRSYTRITDCFNMDHGGFEASPLG